MRNKKILTLLSGVVVCAASAFAISISTVAWFSGRNAVDTLDKLGGSVLQSYFHKGIGTASDPFTITTPLHYENFVKLHYNVKDFDKQGFHFQFGDTRDMPGSPTSPVFYATNNHGVVDYSNSSTVLDLGDMDLPPLGTDTKPFFGQVDGSGLTIQNFNIKGKGYNDVGIFGFVGNETTQTADTHRANIRNCYWNDFTINATESAPEYFKHSADESKHDDTVEVGYLAGHVVDAGSFTNCYVNNCTIEGESPIGKTNNTYGYYGKAEIDSIGGHTGKGQDYKYTLSSKKVFQTLNQNYNTIRENPMRARVDEDGKHYTEYNTPFHNPEWVNNAATDPFSDAITKNGNNTFVLNGNTVNGTSYPRNYSLSTIGYQPLKGGEKKEYNVTYGDGVIPPEETVVGTEDEVKPIPEQGDKGEFITYRSANEQWVYQHSENDRTSEIDAVECTLNLSCSSSFTIRNLAAFGNPEKVSGQAYVMVDNQIIDGYPKNLASWDARSTTLWTRCEYSNIKLAETSVTVKLTRGVHYVSFFILFNINNNQCTYTQLYDSTCPVSCTNRGAVSVTQKPIEITQAMYEGPKSGRAFSFSATSNSHQNADAGSKYTSVTGDGQTIKEIPPYVHPNTFETNLYGTNISSGEQTLLKDSTLTYRKDYYYDTIEGVINGYYHNGKFYASRLDGGGYINEITPVIGKIYLDNDSGNPVPYTWNGTSYVTNQIINGYYKDGNFYSDEECTQLITPSTSMYYQNLFNGTFYRHDGIEYIDVNKEKKFRWIAENNPAREVDYDAKSVYIADDPIMTTEEKDSSGKVIYNPYNYKNIDIVGGGVTFYYLERLLFWTIDLEVISLPSENSNYYIVDSINENDLGQPFYATKYCPGSVVMYVKNYSNAADTIDHTLGNVSFTYINVTLGGSSRINLEEPSFRKGKGHFVDVRSMGSQTGGGTLEFTTTFACDITESGAKKCSYCCLDKDGNILGYFDENGNPGIGFKKADGTTDTQKLLDIDTYVVVLGARANLNRTLNPAYITEVNFSYKAKEGYGGTFGSVGFRSAPDQIENTILNFNYTSEKDNRFTIKVEYVAFTTSEGEYLGKYLITCSSEQAVTLNIFNYDTVHYYIVINGGEPQTLDNIEIVIGPTG